MFSEKNMRLPKIFIIVLFFLSTLTLPFPSNAAIFKVNRAKLYFNGGNDRFTISGKINTGLIDLGKDDLTIQVGSYSETIAAGSFRGEGKKYIYKAEGSNFGIKKMVLDSYKKSFSVTAQGIDLYGTENPVNIVITIGDSYSECITVNMKKIKNGSVLKFNGVNKRVSISSSKCKSVLPANIIGGCNLRLSEPKNCEKIKLPYVFGWTTDGTYCETPWTFVLAGNPVNVVTEQNTWQWSLSEDVDNLITHYGGVKRITAKDLKHVKTNNGVYHWVVMSYYGSHPASRAFMIKK